jgi:hypothetical protein
LGFGVNSDFFAKLKHQGKGEKRKSKKLNPGGSIIRLRADLCGLGGFA